MMSKNAFSRVDRQVCMLIGVVLLLTSIASFFVSTEIFYRAIVRTLGSRVENIHNYIEHQVTPESFLEVNGRQDMVKPSYRHLKEEMATVRSITDISYLYTAKKDSSGKLIYVVDGLSSDAEDFRYPGDPIEPEIQDKLEQALRGEIVLPDRILPTDWGNIFVAYYPLHDERGHVLGAIGIELPADAEAAAFAELKRAISLTCAFFFLVSFATSLYIFRRISNPLYRDLSNTDFMTNLKNRNAYEIDRSNIEARTGGRNMTVFVIDLNNLKLANDVIGHDMGDRCIAEAGRVIKSVESGSITGYRYGGDEFVLFAADVRDPEEIRSRVKAGYEDFAASVREVPVALAVGWAAFDPALDRTLEDTQKRADEHMYEDKVRIKESLGGGEPR